MPTPSNLPGSPDKRGIIARAVDSFKAQLVQPKTIRIHEDDLRQLVENELDRRAAQLLDYRPSGGDQRAREVGPVRYFEHYATYGGASGIQTLIAPNGSEFIILHHLEANIIPAVMALSTSMFVMYQYNGNQSLSMHGRNYSNHQVIVPHGTVRTFPQASPLVYATQVAGQVLITGKYQIGKV